MANSLEAFRLSNNADFQKRIRVILTNQAISVLNELGSVVEHGTRVKYAGRVLRNAELEGWRAALLLVAQYQAAAADAQRSDGGHGSFSDGELVAAIDGLFNTLAGVVTDPAVAVESSNTTTTTATATASAKVPTPEVDIKKGPVKVSRFRSFFKKKEAKK
ncbi:hypothetical protein LCGC14_1834720 [marine sediment metagenome]|uniref:Uncharacterized protein n=1 Tax=marine sediment metagenome TaxID=412755 RepID=A0A0F9JEJ3_9ZZZZ